MDKGFFGVLRESINITYLWRNLFIQITLATIFPLSLLFLGQLQISELFYKEDGSSKIIKWTVLWFFKTTYFVFFLILSLISTSIVVYAVSCFYTSKDITFLKVMDVVPKVGKQLTVTLLWSFIVTSTYNLITSLILDSWLGFVEPTSVGSVIVCFLFVLYMIGFLYISVLCHLASVVAVLEEDCGIAAMIASKTLAKGKMVVSMSVFLVLYLCFMSVQVIYQRFVVVEGLLWTRIVCGVVGFLLLSGFTLFGLVVQTVIYFVCKWHQREKLCLADRVEVYLGEYESLRSKDDDSVVSLYV